MGNGRAAGQQDRIDIMLRTLGLGPDGEQHGQRAGDLFGKPVAGPRYESDLDEAQRQMRAQADKRSLGRGNFVTPQPARQIYPSTSLPKMLSPANEARAIDYRRQGIEIPKDWETERRAALAADEAIPDSISGSQHPGTLESMIPIWGSGREARADFEDGHYVEAAGNALMAASDVFLAKALLTGLAKGAFKTAGSHSWGATRKWMGKRGYLQPWQEGHHWFVPQGRWGKPVLDWIKNQPWNIKGMKSREFHNAVHGVGDDPFGPVGRVWHGSPAWPKATAVSVGGRSIPDNEDE